jgi:hypothetical protein
VAVNARADTERSFFAEASAGPTARRREPRRKRLVRSPPLPGEQGLARPLNLRAILIPVWRSDARRDVMHSTHERELRRTEPAAYTVHMLDIPSLSGTS